MNTRKIVLAEWRKRSKKGEWVDQVCGFYNFNKGDREGYFFNKNLNDNR